MMRFPLTLGHIFERAGRLFPQTEIVSRLPNKSLHRYKYSDFYKRARLLGAALRWMGLKRGERVATLMWNHYAHLEAYFAIPCIGGVRCCDGITGMRAVVPSISLARRLRMSNAC